MVLDTTSVASVDNSNKYSFSRDLALLTFKKLIISSKHIFQNAMNMIFGQQVLEAEIILLNNFKLGT